MTTRRPWGLLLAGALLLTRPVGAQAQLPLLDPMPPSTMVGLHSINSDVATSIFFDNTLSFGVNVYWLDYSGNEVFYAFLDGGQGYTQGTYVTHPWLIRDAGTNDALVGFLPTADASEADIVDARVVPEPISLILLATGLLGVVLIAGFRGKRPGVAA